MCRSNQDCRSICAGTVCKSKKFSKLSPPRGLEGKNNTSLTFLAYFPKNTQIEGKLPHRFAKILVSANNLRIN